MPKTTHALLISNLGCFVSRPPHLSLAAKSLDNAKVSHEHHTASRITTYRYHFTPQRVYGGGGAQERSWDAPTRATSGPAPTGQGDEYAPAHQRLCQSIFTAAATHDHGRCPHESRASAGGRACGVRTWRRQSHREREQRNGSGRWQPRKRSPRPDPPPAV
ncbi:hypothetical protein BDZ97DRAFT_588038 [Flammula alnicola]|nr:hypothetical protein BDZ97DRAFT_588038 [Flammula alnicola]